MNDSEKKQILEKAEQVTRELGLINGTWYVAHTYPKEESETIMFGYFLLTPDINGDRVILIDLDTKKVYLVPTTTFVYIELIGSVRDGKASEKVW